MSGSGGGAATQQIAAAIYNFLHSLLTLVVVWAKTYLTSELVTLLIKSLLITLSTVVIGVVAYALGPKIGHMALRGLRIAFTLAVCSMAMATVASLVDDDAARAVQDMLAEYF